MQIYLLSYDTEKKQKKIKTAKVAKVVMKKEIAATKNMMIQVTVCKMETWINAWEVLKKRCCAIRPPTEETKTKGKCFSVACKDKAAIHFTAKVSKGLL